MTMEIFVYLHSNDVSVEGRRNNYTFPFIISIKLNGCDDRNLTDMREKKNYGRNSFRWCFSRTFSGMKCVMIKEMWRVRVVMDIPSITERRAGRRAVGDGQINDKNKFRKAQPKQNTKSSCS